MLPRLSLATLLSVLAAGTAMAHPGHGPQAGMVAGFMHPMTGIDHILAMVTVGLFAAHLGGRALWMVPASFMAMMAVGGVLGMAGMPLPFVETGIALSVLALGAMVALRVSMPVAAAAGLVGLFALFHGHAHGAEMPANASGLEYALGFVAATGVLHLSGIALGVGLSRLPADRSARISQLGGAGIALAGLALLVAAS